MIQEDKELLLKDLCARLSYGVKATTTSNGWNGIYAITGCIGDRIYLDCPIYEDGDDEWLAEMVKPYLRPMSSMTEKEQRYIWDTYGPSPLVADFEDAGDVSELFGYCRMNISKAPSFTDWLNSHHFDYRGLIKKGLALEAPEGMYEIQD